MIFSKIFNPFLQNNCNISFLKPARPIAVLEWWSNGVLEPVNSA